MEPHYSRPRTTIDETQDDIDTVVARLALEWVFEDSYPVIAAAAVRDGVSMANLSALGHRIAEDAVRLARGEITAIVVPARWPRADEHQRRSQRFWRGHEHDSTRSIS